MTSQAVDDYLKAILELGGAHDDRVTSNMLAERLGVRAPSVSGMLKKLASQQPSFVVYEKSRGVRLTTAGKRRAWELVRHHRLLELFLHNVLKYSWDEVHEEAERLEHFISERFEDRMAAILGDPEIDPHGHVIPQRHGPYEPRPETPLLEYPVGGAALVSSVSDRDAANLRELERLGVKPGEKLQIEQVKTNRSLMIRLEGSPDSIRLSHELAEVVRVVPVR